MRRKTIESVLQKYNNKLMSMSGVVGTAIGKYRKQPCITIFILSQEPEIRQRLPSTLDGYAVRVEETGEFQALSDK